MKFLNTIALLLAVVEIAPVQAFTPASLSRQPQQLTTSSSLSSSLFNNDDKNPAGTPSKDMMDMAAQQMKNMKPEDFERMTNELDEMNAIQKGALKAMGMDPEMMKKSLKMMKENPAMVESAQKMMANMTPEQLMASSKQAQEKMNQMSPEQLEQTSEVMKTIPKEAMEDAVKAMEQQPGFIDAVLDSPDAADDDSAILDDNKSIPTGPGTSSDPAVKDAMFKTAELLSDPPSGGCTFAGFSALPVILLLSGDREVDLSRSELRECWETGSLGATRLDRNGFERVWTEVQDYFEDDIMDEARKEAKSRSIVKKKRGAEKSTATAAATPAATVVPTVTTVGQNINDDQLKAVNEQVKNMSDDDVNSMLESMSQMGPAEEARMKAMGVDPTMMRRTAEMMKSNPMMREAAQNMMKNMTPEQMLQASQNAQQQMAGMSKEEIEQAMKNLENQK